MALSEPGRSSVTRATCWRISRWTPLISGLGRNDRPGFGEHFVGVLAEPRRRTANRGLRVRHANRAADEAKLLLVVPPHDQHLVVRGLRIGERLAQVANGSAQQVHRLHPREPMLGRAGLVALAE